MTRAPFEGGLNVQDENVLGKRFVLEPGESEWEVYPLEARKAGWDKPDQLSTRLSKGEGQPFHNLRTVIVEGPGLKQVLVPDLNFFPAWQSSGGQIRRYDQLERVEPPATLFEPPPGAPQREHTQPKPRRRAAR